jgi:hypothetical protein
MNHPGSLHWHNGGDAARQVASELEAGAVEGELAAGRVKDEAHVLSDHTRLHVRNEPMKALLWAAPAGAVLTGLAWAGSRRGR